METPTWTLQDRIRKAREHAKFNQTALAEAIGVSKNSVNRWETGERNPSQKSIEAISQATGVSASWLNGQDDAALAPSNTTTPPERITLEWNGDGYQVAGAE